MSKCRRGCCFVSKCLDLLLQYTFNSVTYCKEHPPGSWESSSSWLYAWGQMRHCLPPNWWQAFYHFSASFWSAAIVQQLLEAQRVQSNQCFSSKWVVVDIGGFGTAQEAHQPLHAVTVSGKPDAFLPSSLATTPVHNGFEAQASFTCSLEFYLLTSATNTYCCFLPDHQFTGMTVLLSFIKRLTL